jgi:hypothetical protein
MGGRGGGGASTVAIRQQIELRRERNQTGDVQGQVVKAIRKVTRNKPEGSNTWTDIATVREQLPDVSKTEFDNAIRELARSRKIFLIPEENQKTLTTRRREGGVSFGDEMQHMMRMPRPK